jgi:hypothetical protein
VWTPLIVTYALVLLALLGVAGVVALFVTDHRRASGQPPCAGPCSQPLSAVEGCPRSCSASTKLVCCDYAASPSCAPISGNDRSVACQRCAVAT